MKEFAFIIVFVMIFTFFTFCTIEKIETNILSVLSENVDNDNSPLIILDAGHGGEDSGAVGFDGTFEKNLNLEICSKISLFFDILGIDYIKIRTEDKAVGDTSLKTIRSRKISDIKTRYALVNTNSNSILLSIHQNMYSVEKYSGTQVFYSENIDESKKIAQFIQNTVKDSMQPNNNRKIKAADKNIYLLYNAKQPSVMVECGFMSNLTELQLLKQAEYQSKISYFIVSGLIKYFYSVKEV